MGVWLHFFVELVQLRLHSLDSAPKIHKEFIFQRILNFAICIVPMIPFVQKSIQTWYIKFSIKYKFFCNNFFNLNIIIYILFLII